MTIDRKELLHKNNPVLREIDIQSPLTVGNGELAFTADVTGFQTLYDTYQMLPLCTMSQWAWHTEPVSSSQDFYTLADLEMTEYDCQGRTVYYPKKKKPGNEAVYDWLRQNPHRLNLAKIGLRYDGNIIAIEDLDGIRQELHLYEGILESEYHLHGIPFHVRTACHPRKDCLAYEIVSDAVKKNNGFLGQTELEIAFPYGSADISGSDWAEHEGNRTDIVVKNESQVLIKRCVDKDRYYAEIRIEGNGDINVRQEGCRIFITPLVEEGNTFSFTVYFSQEGESGYVDFGGLRDSSASKVFEASSAWWQEFWEEGGIIRLNRSRDERAAELERRILLSKYLMAVNSAGSQPPQETGLICNSWYGKMHLEMHVWHAAWLPLWNHTKLLERSFGWYLEHREAARENAARNGYAGVRWPKMIASEGIDCPSPIAPLLIWQQPHIIYMLELAYRKNPSDEFLEKYWVLVKETADFMVSFLVYNEEKDCYDIPAPVIPVQECHQPEETKNPAFELEYWYVTLKIARDWAKRMGKGEEGLWMAGEKMASMTVKDGLYMAHEFCPDTFERFNRDHPSMTGSFGLLKGRADPEIMKNTLGRILDDWQYLTLWGWDFAMMAMTATRLGLPEVAVDILMKDTGKNRYVASGNNLQESRADLPLYLPGNGALLLAIPIMAAGYPGCSQEIPGFPKDGNWVVEFEGIEPFFD